ncbi:MAG: phosphotransferase, partial [Candidatus Zixiibacteriota bacterium]
MIIKKPKRPEFTCQDAQQIASDFYDITATASELPSERDQNFRLVASGSEEYVLKIANSEEDRSLLDFQNQQMQHLSSAGLSERVPRVYPDSSGQSIAEIEGAGGAKHFVRLVSFIKGTPLSKVAPHTPELLEDLGRLLGKVSKALEGFEHPAAVREFHWDIKNASSVISSHLSDIGNPQQRDIVKHFLKMFETVVVPLRPGFRTSVIHNDANDYNVLVTGSDTDPMRSTVSGIVDYGDSVYSHTINELAVALAYAMLDKAEPLDAAASVITGYNEIYRLEENELEVLFPLTCIRLALSVTIAAYQQKQEPDNEYLGISERPAWALLERLMNVDQRWAHFRFRSACGLTPHPAAGAFVKWVDANKDKFGCVTSPPLKEASVTALDLSMGSPIVDAIAFNERAVFISELMARIRAAGDKVTVGRYAEARRHAICAHPADPKVEPAPCRNVHLGMDIFVSPGTEVLAVFDGKIAAFNSDGEDTAVLIRHQPGSGPGPFYSVYRYLSPESVEKFRVGQKVKKGDRLGEVGKVILPTHVHFQLALVLLDYNEKLPGASTPAESDIWLSICPDPNLVLQIPRGRFPATGRSVSELRGVRDKVIGKSLSIAYR